MTKVYITDLDDLSVGDILYHAGDYGRAEYMVTEIDTESARPIRLSYRSPLPGGYPPVWTDLGTFMTVSCGILNMWKIKAMYDYHQGQTGDTDDDI